MLLYQCGDNRKEMDAWQPKAHTQGEKKTKLKKYELLLLLFL
jgi:hypothetical protein